MRMSRPDVSWHDEDGDITIWHPKKFFAFYLSSLVYCGKLAFNLLTVVVPMGLQAGVWSLQTVVKLIVLFFALIILVVGPKIGMPAVIYQQTWVRRSACRAAAYQPSRLRAPCETASLTVSQTRRC